MLIKKTNMYRIFSTVLSAVFIFSSAGVNAFAAEAGGTQVQAVSGSGLRERGLVPPAPRVNQAQILDANWVQLYLPEKEYNILKVTDSNLYTVTSTDDADFSTAVKPVLANHRFFPEEAPFNDTFNGSMGEIQVIYRVFLKMPMNKRFKEGKSYTVNVDASVAAVDPLTTTFSITKPNEAIHANQVGYVSDGPKVAYMSYWTGEGSIDFSIANEFQLIDENTGKSVYTGSVNFLISGADEKWSKSNVYSMDFSAFNTQGKYHIYVPGVGISYPFEISANIYKDQIGYTLIRGMTMQRDNNAGLDDPNVTHWNRPAAHLDDAIDQATGQKVDLTGGHMDAGDRGKYSWNVADAVAIDLSAAELFPKNIETLGETLQIPESNNGKPDYLDETVYELDYLYKLVMNTGLDGGISQWLKPVGEGYEFGYPAEGASGRIYFDGADADGKDKHGPIKQETLFGAAALAMAYNTPIMQKYFPEKCQQYLTAALKAFKAYEDHKDSTTYWDTTHTNDLYYEDQPYAYMDELLLAASTLLQATGEAKYSDYINQVLNDLKAFNGHGLADTAKWGWQTGGPWIYSFLTLYKTTDSKLSDAVKQEAKAAILKWADTQLGYSKPFGMPRVNDTYNQVGWYFSGDQIGFPQMMAYGVSSDKKYRDQIVNIWNYLLGTNPISRTFISGLGDPQRSPRWQVHEISYYEWTQYKAGNGGWSEMPPGLPAADLQDGKYQAYFNDSWNSSRVNKVFPKLEDYPALYRYTDAWNVNNEFSYVTVARNAASIIPLVPDTVYSLTAAPDDAAKGSVAPSSGNYISGETAKITASAALGYKFSNWSGDLTGTANPASVVMNSNKTITANFVQGTVFTLNTNGTNGNVFLEPAPGPGGQYNEGTTVTVKAVPDNGYEFTGWGGDLSGSTNPTTIVMDGNKTITASFSEATTFSLTTNAEGGTVAADPEKTIYSKGDSVTLLAQPDEGYEFTGWSGDASGTENPITVTMDANKNITANFAPLPKYSVNLSADNGGSLYPQSGLYLQGKELTLNATPDEGYMFTGWSGDIVSTLNPISITVSKDMNIKANFANKYSVINMDLGTQTSGTTTESDGKITIGGSGANLNYAPDGFRYVFETGLKQDNFEISTRLDNVVDAGSNSKAGLQIRGTLATNSPYISVFVQDGKLVVQKRNGGDSYDVVNNIINNSSSLPVNGPVWLKLSRNNNWSYNIYISEDGTNWNKFINTVDIWSMWNVEVTAGLFVSSGNEGSLTTAAFSNTVWPVKPVAPPIYKNADITTATKGSTLENTQGEIIVKGSGSGLFGAPDNFRYVYVPGSAPQNTAMIARIDNVVSDNPDAIAGIQYRSTEAGNAMYVAAFIRDGKLIVQKRGGGDWYDSVTNIVNGTNELPVSYPVWLKITREYCLFTVYYSADGSNWTKLTDSFYVWGMWNVQPTAGLFVNSGEEGKLATATFGKVIWPEMFANSITAAIDAITNLPEAADITLTDKAAVTAARGLVDAAKANGAVDANITNLQKLTDSEAKIASLEQAEADKATAITAAVNAIANLPAAADVTLADKAAVTAARELVDAAKAIGTVDSDITNLQKLIDCEAKIVSLEKAEADRAAALEQLKTAVANAKAVFEAAVEGSLEGQYPQGSKAIFKAVIDAAEALIGKASATKEELDSASKKLIEAQTAFTGGKLTKDQAAEIAVIKTIEAAAQNKTSVAVSSEGINIAAVKKAAELGVSLKYALDEAAVEVPAGLIDTTTASGVLKVSSSVVELPKENDGFKVLGQVYDFSIKLYNGEQAQDLGKLFAAGKSAKVSIKLSSEALKDVKDYSTLSAYYYNPAAAQWEQMGGSFDENTMMFTFNAPHFSTYAVMAANPVVPAEVIPQTGSPIDFNMLLVFGIIIALAGLGIARKTVRK